MLISSGRARAALFAFLLTAPVFAQNISGVLTGTVKDSAGSVMHPYGWVPM